MKAYHAVSVVSLCLISSSAFSAMPAPTSYKITLIDSAYGSVRLSPNAINNNGMVVGTAPYCCGNGPTKGFSWTETGGKTFDPNYNSEYRAVNNKGDIAGTMGGSNRFFWPTVRAASGQYFQRYTFPNPGMAVSINDVGFATGYAGGISALWSYVQNQWTPISFRSTAINNNNAIVGHSLTSPATAMIYDPFSGERSLGTLGATSIASDINDAGIVVGHGTSNSGACTNGCGFIYNPVGGIKALPKLASGSAVAKSVNISGDSVGSSFDANNKNRAVLWNNGVIIDLNTRIPSTSGWILQDAVGINDNGQIVGTGTLNGVFQIFVLTPEYNICS